MLQVKADLVLSRQSFAQVPVFLLHKPLCFGLCEVLAYVRESELQVIRRSSVGHLVLQILLGLQDQLRVYPPVVVEVLLKKDRVFLVFKMQ